MGEASTKASKGQEKLKDKTVEATRAMIEQAEAAEKVKSEVEKSAETVISEVSDLLQVGLESGTQQAALFRQLQDESGKQGEALGLLLVAARDGGLTMEQITTALGNSADNLSDQISMLIAVGEQAEAALGKMDIGAAMALTGGVAAEDFVFDITEKIEARLVEQDKKARKSSKKRSKSRASATKKDAVDVAEAVREGGLLLLSEMDRERLEITNRFNQLIFVVGAQNAELAEKLAARRDIELGKLTTVEPATGAAEAAALLVLERQKTVDKSFQRGLKESAKLADKFQKTQADIAARNTQVWVDSFHAVASGFGGMLVSMLQSGASFREQIFTTLGTVFGQLGAAFIAWATAEGSLLAGNPFGAIAAAVALQTIAGVIGSFGQRKPGGGGGGGGQAARREFDDRNQRDREQAPRIMVLNYGFWAPDETALSAGQAVARGRNLTGTQVGRQRGR
jgi:hypothetical protein